MLAAVTFDFWQTLAFEPRERFLHGARVRAWEELLAATGAPRSREEIERVFDDVARHHGAEWRAGRLFGAADAATWALAQLEPDVDEATAGRLVEAFADAGAGVELHLTPNIRDALAALEEAGVRLGIVCDV